MPPPDVTPAVLIMLQLYEDERVQAGHLVSNDPPGITLREICDRTGLAQRDVIRALDDLGMRELAWVTYLSGASPKEAGLTPTGRPKARELADEFLAAQAESGRG